MQHPGIPRVSIFRPGMLNRLTGDRLGENIINWFGLGLRVDTLAKAMIVDAETDPVQGPEKEEPVFYKGNSLISKLASFL